MKHFLVFLCIVSISIFAIFLGNQKISTTSILTRKEGTLRASVPSIGSIEVLNGCGANDVAAKCADILREKGFDVKKIDNAETWNYPFTVVVAHTKEALSIAEQICNVLDTDKYILMRTEDTLYNVSVILGSDFYMLLK